MSKRFDEEQAKKPFNDRECHHCKGLICIRMPVPSSECDHLYYPDNCAVCRKRRKQ